jgi:hypothetical protein
MALNTTNQTKPKPSKHEVSLEEGLTTEHLKPSVLELRFCHSLQIHGALSKSECQSEK